MDQETFVKIFMAKFAAEKAAQATEKAEAEGAPSEACPHSPRSASMGGRHKRTPSVYLITSPNGKQYVGQTVWPRVRMNKYKSNKFISKQRFLTQAIKKHGWANMKVKWLAGGPGKPPVTEESLDSLEEGFIASLGTQAPNGYNIQKGGKVTWRGVAGLSRTAPRGPRTEQLKQQLRDTWSQKRDKRLADADPEVARAKRLYAAKAQETKLAKQAGAHEDGRFKPSQARKDTWKRKREAKLALLPPEKAAKKRAKMEKDRDREMAKYYAKQARTAETTAGKQEA